MGCQVIAQAVRTVLSSVQSNATQGSRKPGEWPAVRFDIVSMAEEVTTDTSGGWVVGVAVLCFADTQLGAMELAESVRAGFHGGPVTVNVTYGGSTVPVSMVKTAFEVSPSEVEEADGGAVPPWVAEVALALSVWEV